jgi:hypothetical protein
VLDLVEERRPDVAPADFLGHELHRYKSLGHGVEQIPDPKVTQRMGARDPGLGPVRGIVLDDLPFEPGASPRIPIGRQGGTSSSPCCRR